MVLGANLTGNTDNTVFVNALNIKLIGSTTSLVDLGLDSNGNVVSGTSANPSGLLKSFTYLTASTTYNVPAGINNILVECIGGGAGGGGAAGSAGIGGGAAGGGGGGSYAKKYIKNVSGSAYTINIGSGGTGGVAGNNIGMSGGNTTFDALITAYGGIGGNGSAFVTGGINNGGNGGILAIGGDVNIGGQSGLDGIILSSALGISSGSGGSSQLGSGANSINASGIGLNALGYGAGGSGAATNSNVTHSGGTGSIGIIIVTEYS